MLLMLALEGWIYDGYLISSDPVIKQLARGESKVLWSIIKDTVIKPIASGYPLKIKPASPRPLHVGVPRGCVHLCKRGPSSLRWNTGQLRNRISLARGHNKDAITAVIEVVNYFINYVKLISGDPHYFPHGYSFYCVQNQRHEQSLDSRKRELFVGQIYASASLER